MYTSTPNIHLIIHAFQPAWSDVDLTIVRVTACHRVKDYIDEMKCAYNVEPQICDVNVFYNCGKYHDRIIKEMSQHPLGTSFADGVYKVLQTDVDEWINNAKEYLIYVCKLKGSIFKTITSDWRHVRTLPMRVQDVSNNSLLSFCLTNYETDLSEEWIVLDEDIVLSMILTILYVERFLNSIPTPELDHNNSLPKQVSVQIKSLLQGCMIDKDELTVNDLKAIVCHLGIDLGKFKYADVITSTLDDQTNHLDTYQANSLIESYARIDTEFNCNTTNVYTSLEDAYDDILTPNDEMHEKTTNKRKCDGEQVPKIGDTFMGIVTPMQISSNHKCIDEHGTYKHKETLCDNDYKIQIFNDHTESSLCSHETHVPFAYLYRVPISQTLVQSPKKLMLLREVSLVTEKPIRVTLIQQIEHLKQQDLKDLLSILTVLVDDPTCSNFSTNHNTNLSIGTSTKACECTSTMLQSNISPSTSNNMRVHEWVAPKSEGKESSKPLEDSSIDRTISAMMTQRRLTHEYARLFKDDNANTNARVVIKNITHYLLKHLREDEINTNEISNDLLCAGIKKARRAHGYVYGIEDTSRSRGYAETNPTGNYSNRK